MVNLDFTGKILICHRNHDLTEKYLEVTKLVICHSEKCGLKYQFSRHRKMKPAFFF